MIKSSKGKIFWVTRHASRDAYSNSFEWKRGKGRSLPRASCKNISLARSGAVAGLPSYCFPLGANLNLFDHSTPPVTHDSLHRNVTPLPIPSLLWRCSGDRNGAINICQQTVDILSPPTTIYVVRRMPSCFVGPAIPQGALPLRTLESG